MYRFENCSIKSLIWLIEYLLFYVPLKNFSLYMATHHCRWRAAKFRPMLGAQGLWAGRDLYRATPAVTRTSVFSASSEGPPHLVASYDTQGDVRGVIHYTSAALYFMNGFKVKDIVSKLTVKFWMCQKCGKMKDYNNKRPRGHIAHLSHIG
jgi:hypothetical protein